MLVCCWSAKGGSGTTVVACALALLLGRSEGGAVLVDLAGDVPSVCGLADGVGPAAAAGLAGWLHAAPGVPADGLARLERPVAPGLSVVPRGSGPLTSGAADLLVAALDADPRPVVVDAGVLGRRPEGPAAQEEVALAVAGAATRSLLVVRPCYLSLRRALDAPIRPSGVVLVAEDGRALTTADVEGAVGAPVVAEVRVTAQIARAVDAGIFASHLPRSLDRDLRHAA